MLRLILFWLLRILAVIAVLVNLIYFEYVGIWSIFAIMLGLLACINLYVWGLFARETNKKLPGLFLLFRTIQGIIVFIFNALDMKYFGTYILLDTIFYGLLLYDSRFKFVYREPRTDEKRKIKRD